jgi:hypothetical protein
VEGPGLEEELAVGETGAEAIRNLNEMEGPSALVLQNEGHRHRVALEGAGVKLAADGQPAQAPPRQGVGGEKKKRAGGGEGLQRGQAESHTEQAGQRTGGEQQVAIGGR